MSYDAYPWGRWIKWIVIGLLVIIILGSGVSTYNGLVASEQNVTANWSEVENVMQRRADTINNLVETVKGYAEHEKGILEKVAAARADFETARAVLSDNSEDIGSKLAADTKVKEAAANMINVVVENYPDLKADTQFTNLQSAIEGSENRVSTARGRFILAVQDYNMKIKRFPGNIFAGAMGFGPKDYFEASPEAKEAPKVQF